MISSRTSSQKVPINMPKPYGSIPKHTKRNHKKHQQKNTTTSIKKSRTASAAQAPYPFFSSLTPTSTFYSFFHSLFHSDQTACKESSPVGFMPRATHHTTKTQMSQLDIIVPVSSPIDCYYDDGGDATYDNCSSFSTSSGSSHSDGSLSSFSSYMEVVDDVRNHVRNSLTSNSVSTAALSDILCDHYVQTQMNAPPSSSDDDDIVDVPLETFCMYEAPPTKYKNWMLGSTMISKEWTLVETLSEKPKRLQRKIQEKEEIPSTTTKEIITHMDRQYQARDTRANTAYLRMIVAEVNMMRSQKIVGPLRPRRVLPKRSDRFIHRPSPLQLIMI